MPDTHTRTQHTPGPWYTMERGENALSIEAELYDGSAHPVTLATATNCIMEGEANARLIAAAPDLLAALELVLPKVMATRTDCLCDAPEIDAPCSNCRIRTARAAIAKARGEE